MICIRICCFSALFTDEAADIYTIIMCIITVKNYISKNKFLFMAITGIFFNHTFRNIIFPTSMPYIYPDYCCLIAKAKNCIYMLCVEKYKYINFFPANSRYGHCSTSSRVSVSQIGASIRCLSSNCSTLYCKKNNTSFFS